jgi:TRAP transporter 4TM/12TM fusion protein
MIDSAHPLAPDDVAVRRLTGFAGRFTSALAVGLSLYSLYWVLFVVQPQVYRVSFLLVALVLTFLLVPVRRTRADRIAPLDWMLAGATVAALGWPLVDFNRFLYRAADPLLIDVLLGATMVALVLEATRRSVGWILPATAACFIGYALAGPWFDRVGLSLLAHRGYPVDRLVGTLYITLEGVFGVPLDVAATYIILFTLYGAVLEQSGAGRFFIDWALALMGKSRSGAAPGRSVTLAGFLLGTVSGSGVATTVMLGSVSWPLLRRAGYRPAVAGAILSAAGIGALLSPPTLGAAAFLIAELLRISYLQVLVMATVPTLLYYVSIFLMIEADSRRLGTRALDGGRTSAWSLARHSGYHFSSLAAIALFMVWGMSAFRAVFYATLLAVALSYIRRATALTPSRLVAALKAGSLGVLGVTVTTATAGIIVGVVGLTGLGLKVAGIIVSLAGGQLFLTVIYSACAVWLLGLAVPVTASYIIAAVMVAPALVQSGVPDFAAHMFIFYYAVLSEVSPPTALSPFAAAAITGASPFETMMLTWKYTLPAFLVPLVFTLTPDGAGALLRGPAGTVALTCLTAAAGVGAIAGGLGGWVRARTSAAERCGLVGGGLLLLYAAPLADGAGCLLTSAALLAHIRRTRNGAGEKAGAV